MEVSIKCKMCGKSVVTVMSEQQYKELKLGEKLIQTILPYAFYTAEQREMFISGVCDTCWDKLFPSEEEEEDEEEM